MKKSLEELRLDLIEVQACKKIQEEGFSFDGETMIYSDSNYALDPYYESAEKNLLATIEKIEAKKAKEKNNKKIKKMVLNKRSLY